MKAKIRIVELELEGDEAAIGGAMEQVAAMFRERPSESAEVEECAEEEEHGVKATIVDLEAIRAEEEEADEAAEQRNEELELADEVPAGKPNPFSLSPFTEEARREVARLKLVEGKSYSNLKATKFPCVDGSRRFASAGMIADSVRKYGAEVKRDEAPAPPSPPSPPSTKTACVVGMEPLGIAVLQVLREHGVKATIVTSKSGDFYPSSVRTFNRIDACYFFNMKRPPGGFDAYIVTDGTTLPESFPRMEVNELLDLYPNCAFADAARKLLKEVE